MSASSLDLIGPLALAFPETAASSHLGALDFRVRGKIFVNVSAEASRAVLKLPPLVQEAMIQDHPLAVSKVEGWWGQHGWTTVLTDKIGVDILKDLLGLSWRLVAPKSLVRDLKTAAKNSE